MFAVLQECQTDSEDLIYQARAPSSCSAPPDLLITSDIDSKITKAGRKSPNKNNKIGNNHTNELRNKNGKLSSSENSNYRNSIDTEERVRLEVS